MPKLQTIDGKTRHYAYTPEGKKAYERDKAAMQMSPTAKLRTLDVDGGTSGGGGATYTPPKQKPKKIPSSRSIYPNTPKPSTTSPNTKKMPTTPRRSADSYPKKDKKKNPYRGVTRATRKNMPDY